MMLPPPPERWPIPETPSREVLLEWARANAPDMRITKVRLEGGRRACRADFTFAGERIEVEAVESDELPDPDDAIVRRAAWVIYRRMGVTMPTDDAERERLTAQIVEASLRGDAQLADAIGRELALRNEGFQR